MSVISRYQTDMDQILSNFIPFSNPYVVISWKVPKKFNLAVDQEIRSEVLWDGNVSLSYPTELASTNKARITADTSFTIKSNLYPFQGSNKLPFLTIALILFFLELIFVNLDACFETSEKKSLFLCLVFFSIAIPT